MQPDIIYLTRKELNIEKWDDCIARSFNGVIYAYSWYLDNMADHQWNALVLGDYIAVMPLPWRKKYGIYYIYQPSFSQRLGIFSSEILSEEIKQLFYHSIPSRFKYWDFNIDKYSVIESAEINFSKKKNYILDLSLPYNEIYSSYSQLTKRTIKKKGDYKIVDNILPEDIIAFYKLHYTSIIKDLKDQDYNRFKSLCSLGKKLNTAFSLAIYDDQEKTIAVMILFHDLKNTYYYIMGGLDKKINNNPGLYKLFDYVIQKLSGKKNTLDFEGSDIANIASFYEKFGAQKDHYYHLSYNKLPWPVNFLKK